MYSTPPIFERVLREMNPTRKLRIREIVGVYVPTPKNRVVRNHYDDRGFTPADEFQYRTTVPERAVLTATPIKTKASLLSS